MDNSWKLKPVSPAQSNLLEKLGYTGKPPLNSGKASDLINKYKLIQGAEKLRANVDYDLNEDFISVGNEVIGQYSAFLTKCIEKDITEGMVIGMLFNNVKADLRAKQTNI